MKTCSQCVKVADATVVHIYPVSCSGGKSSNITTKIYNEVYLLPNGYEKALLRAK